MLCAAIFFMLFSFIIRFSIIKIIKENKIKTEDNKEKEIKRGKRISVFLFLIAIFWMLLFIFYNKLI